MKMNAIMFHAPGDIRYEEVDVPEIEADEVLVRVKTALTCGTDVKTFRRGHPVLIKTVPSGFGHEFAGIVEQVGENVTSFKRGQKVVAANSAPCMQCFYCGLGEYNLCENLNLLNGAFAEYIKVPAQIVKYNMLEIPEHVSFDEAAFVEPLANVLHGAERTEIKAGQTVGVIGLGPIGLMFVKVAKLKGARVIAMGRNPLKLKLAKDFAGADEVIDLTTLVDPVEEIKSLTPGGKGLDIAIEAVGLPALWEKALKITRRGGTVNLFGGCKSGTTIELDTRRVHYDEIKIISIFHHTPAHIKEALNLISDGSINVKKLITAQMPLSEGIEGIKMHDDGRVIKAALHP
ncbi:MAG: zinc-binding dehydrogenase [bacterium]